MREKLKHIGEGIVYFCSDDDMYHLTSYAERERLFGYRPVPLLVVDWECRIWTDGPFLPQNNGTSRIISVSPPKEYGFSYRDVLRSLNQLSRWNKALKRQIESEMTEVHCIAHLNSLDSAFMESFISNKSYKIAQLVDQNDYLSFYRNPLTGDPAAIRYFDEPIVIIPKKYEGESISYDEYKKWEEEERKGRKDDEERLPIEFHAPMYAVEDFVFKGGNSIKEIVSITSKFN